MRGRTWCALLALVLASAGCKLDFSGLDSIDSYAAVVAESGQVASVTCSTTDLDLATNEAGACMAQNAAGTRLSADGTNVVVWRSSNPAAVSVDLVGNIQAEELAATVWIVAEGTMGSADSVQITSN